MEQISRDLFDGQQMQHDTNQAYQQVTHVTLSTLSCCVSSFSYNILILHFNELYESLVISILLYGAESWPLSVTQMKKLEAAHHKFQRRLLGITWRDKVSDDIRKKTGSRKLENIIKERRLRWLGHVLRMDNSRTARQATHWELRGYKRKPGRPRKNWVDVIKLDLENMESTWEEAEELANDKAEWHQRVAHCSHLVSTFKHCHLELQCDFAVLF